MAFRKNFIRGGAAGLRRYGMFDNHGPYDGYLQLGSSYSTFPSPPEFDWDSELVDELLPREHDFASGQSDLPEGLVFSVLNPLFIGSSVGQISELYSLIGTQDYHHPVKRHFQQLLTFKPERRALHSLAAHVAASVCIYDDEHFVKVCERLYPEVLECYSDKKVILADELERCKEDARRLLSQYMYSYDDTNYMHRQIAFIEAEMAARESKNSKHIDQGRLFKAILVLLQNEAYKSRVYPRVEDAVTKAIDKHLLYTPVSQIPDDVRVDNGALWALPVKPAHERVNHVVAGGTATGKSLSIARFDDQYKMQTGKSGLMTTATLNVDWKRALIKLEDVMLSESAPVDVVTQSWGPLSHMEASIMTKMSLDIISARLEKEGRAPEVFHETTFPEEQVISKLMARNSKLHLYVTNYAPDKAVDGNIQRYKSSGRYVPLDVVLGSQKNAAKMLSDVVASRIGQDLVVEHHDTQKFSHEPDAKNFNLGEMRLKDKKYYIYSVRESLHLIRAMHINPSAKKRSDVYSSTSDVSLERLTAKFLEIYGNLDLVFVDGQNGVGKAYASYSKKTGLQIIDQDLFDRQKSACGSVKELFVQMEKLDSKPQLTSVIGSKY